MPAGPDWLHEIKYDGYRMMIIREQDRVRLISRGVYDWASRFPLVVAAALKLRQKHFVIDGEVGLEGIVSKRLDRVYGAGKCSEGEEPGASGLQQGEGCALSYSVPTRLKLDPNDRTTSPGVSRTLISTPYTSKRVLAPG